MDLQIFKTRVGEFYMYPNDAISQHIMSGRDWEKHFETIVTELMPKDSISIDCGANFGYNSVMMGKTLERGKLICFEPQTKIVQQLAINLKLNGISNYEIYCNCVGESSHKKMFLNPVDYNASWVNIGDTSVGVGGEECESISIDDLSLDNVGFMKLDVQGYEMYVLRGALNTIAKCNPIIFVELEQHQLVKFGFTVADVVAFLKTLKYSVYRIHTATYSDDYICVVDDANISSLLKTLTLEKM